MTEKIIGIKTTTDLVNLFSTPDLVLAAVNDISSLSDDSEVIVSEYQPIATVTLNNGGSGYSVDDVLTVVQSGGSGGTITITSVAAGVVDGISLTTGGVGYVVENALSTTVAPPGGTGCKINITVLMYANLDSVEVLEHIHLTGGDGFSAAQASATVDFTLGAWGEDNVLAASVVAVLYNVTDVAWEEDVGIGIANFMATKVGASEIEVSNIIGDGTTFMVLEDGKEYIWYLLAMKIRQYKGTSDVEVKTSYRKLFIQTAKR